MRSPNKYALRRTPQGEAAKHVPSRQTRQRTRARLRSECHAFIKKEYGPEPRRVRRRIALRLARRRYKAMTTGVLTGARKSA